MDISPSLRAIFPDCSGATGAPDPLLTLEVPPFKLTPASGPKVPIQELERARSALIESTQAGLPRITGPAPSGTTRQDWTQPIDGKLTAPAAVLERDAFPLKDHEIISPDIEMFCDQRVRASELGSGQTSTVFLMEWENRDGDNLELAYKPPISDSKSKGEPPDAPLRNVLSFRLAQLLGFDVVSPAELQLCPEDSKESRPGLFMPRARGETAKQVGMSHPELGDNPNFAREAAKLDVVDFLLDGCDRHRGNYLIHCGPDESVKLTAIDNDTAFSTDGDVRAGFDEMDTETAEAVMKLTPDALRSIVPPGALSTTEVSALLSRLDGLKANIQEMRQGKALIDPSDWDQVMAEVQRRNNVYGKFVLSAGGDSVSDSSP